MIGSGYSHGNMVSNGARHGGEWLLCWWMERALLVVGCFCALETAMRLVVAGQRGETTIVVRGCWPTMDTTMVVGSPRAAVNTAMELHGCLPAMRTITVVHGC